MSTFEVCTIILLAAIAWQVWRIKLYVQANARNNAQGINNNAVQLGKVIEKLDDHS